MFLVKLAFWCFDAAGWKFENYSSRFLKPGKPTEYIFFPVFYILLWTREVEHCSIIRIHLKQSQQLQNKCKILCFWGFLLRNASLTNAVWLRCCVPFSIVSHVRTLSSACLLSWWMKGKATPVFFFAETHSLAKRTLQPQASCCECNLPFKRTKRFQMKGRQMTCWAKSISEYCRCQCLSVFVPVHMWQCNFTRNRK